MSRAVFVCGGTGAIGEALVREFAQRGDHVHFSYNSSLQQAEALAAELNVTPLRLDLANPFDPPDLQPDILVNNAGVNLSGHPLSATSDDEVLATHRVNVLGPLRLCQAYVPGMASRRFGRIININSLWGLAAPANRLSYAMSKHALRALTLSLADELAGDGITVNDICPGPVDSAMLRSMGAEAVASGRFDSVADYIYDVEREMPTGSLVTPEQVAAVAAFLATPEASNCNGLAIKVDGGLL